MGVEFTIEECKAIYGLIDELSGGNPENVFAWDGDDDPNNVTIMAAVKLFNAVGKRIPELLGE